MDRSIRPRQCSEVAVQTAPPFRCAVQKRQNKQQEQQNKQQEQQTNNKCSGACHPGEKGTDI